jgi:fatty-acyl-CoA synthase
MSEVPMHGSEPNSERQALQRWIGAMSAIKILEERPDTTLPSLLRELAAQHSGQPALMGTDETLSYDVVLNRANRYASWALQQGLRAGDGVSLLLPNCPDYVVIWLGLTKIGCIVALLNTGLRGASLAHCIRLAQARHMIVGRALLPVLMDTLADLPQANYWVHGDAAQGLFPRIDEHIAQFSGAEADIAVAARPIPSDKALLIYTSGTTGLPKAAYVSHSRIMEWSYWFAGMMQAESSDRLYDCLPLYHSIGGVVAIGAMLVSGASVVIRPRFSASRFWNDIIENECTIFQYIGELCRYLLQSAPNPQSRAHRLRLACGNGLRSDVWAAFSARFGIEKILEFYAATEGSVSLYNCEGKPGAIGRVPPFLAHRFPMALIKYNIVSGQPERDASGFCIKCGPDEVGEAIGRIDSANAPPSRQFHGYTDATASEAKILRDVFKPGDQWFRTGDLMRKDSAGFYYFVDRAGDSFRWKGENVSTTEVADIIGTCQGVSEAVVFGVQIHGAEGRAGMAAITTNAEFSLQAMQTHLTANLPAHARPVFVRLCEALDRTGTFKLKRDALARDGYNFPTTPGTLFVYHKAQDKLLECTAALQEHIAAHGLMVDFH